ncbi:MAG TPA: FliM/FliN family flagellar motor switch protein [Kofleriaceae bacterium]|nr:FliM/FliN family flagellar motor switch protein [Kofleriaceae bacterium]
MPARAPNFSPYPFERLRRLSRREAAFESAVARHLAAATTVPNATKLADLVRGPVHARLVGTTRLARDPSAALAEVRRDGLAIAVTGAPLAVRQLAQRLLGGPDELAAPRPLTAIEHAIWALVVAAALEDLGIAGEVHATAAAPPADAIGVELAIDLAGLPLAATLWCPRELELRAPPRRPVPRWTFDIPVVVARCALPRDAIGRLAVRDVITVERTLELEIGDSVVRLAAAPSAVEATVATGYVRRAMAPPDDAHLELTVQLGTTRIGLAQLAELAVGQVVSLGRPLAGPFEIRAAGRLLGQGELVDVDGELGVRIVSLTQE